MWNSNFTIQDNPANLWTHAWVATIPIACAIGVNMHKRDLFVKFVNESVCARGVYGIPLNKRSKVI